MLWSGETPSLCWSTLACRIFQVDEGMTVVQMVVRMLMVVVNAADLGAVSVSITVPCVLSVCLSVFSGQSWHWIVVGCHTEPMINTRLAFE